MAYFAAVRGFWMRLTAIIVKEMLPLRRDPLSFGLMFGMPILQLLLFGYAIDTDPRHLPTALVVADQSRITRTVLSALSNAGYMDFTHRPATESEANTLLQRGEDRLYDLGARRRFERARIVLTSALGLLSGF